MGFPRAAGYDDLSAAVLLRADPLIPVLLDGDHLVQTERGALELQGAQSVLDLLPDARAYQAFAVQYRLSDLAQDHDVGGCWFDLPVAVCLDARRLRNRAPALPRQPLCGARHLPRLSGAAVDPVHSAGHRNRAVRPVRLADGADSGLSDLPGAVLHLAADRLFQVDSL